MIKLMIKYPLVYFPQGRANASESKDLNGSYLETLETDNEEMTVAELR